VNKLGTIFVLSILLPFSTSFGDISDGTVISEQKISDTQGNFNGILKDADRFGESVANLGDVDKDGINDLAVGANFDDDGCVFPTNCNRGAVWILFMNTDGTVKDEQKISDTAGSFFGTLDNDDRFGKSVAGIGDLDNDGVPDLAVGAPRDDDGCDDFPCSSGAVWILFLKTDGTVKDFQKISDTEGGFLGGLADGDFFGASVANMKDLDGDGVIDLAVGADRDTTGGGADIGAVWILFLKNDGSVNDFQHIARFVGGFNVPLDPGDEFGTSVAEIGDLDDDGVQDLAVGVSGDDDGGTSKGAVYILFMKTTGEVKSVQKISDISGNFNGVLDSIDRFGASVVGLGDFDGDGIEDIAVGAHDDDDGGANRGAMYILFLNTNGMVKSFQKISSLEGGFSGSLINDADFGFSATDISDLDGNGVLDLVVSAREDNDGGGDRGSVWVLFMKNISPPEPPSPVVGGELIPIETTSLILANTQSFSWMIPLVLSAIGIGLFVFRKSENS